MYIYIYIYHILPATIGCGWPIAGSACARLCSELVEAVEGLNMGGSTQDGGWNLVQEQEIVRV